MAISGDPQAWLNLEGVCDVLFVQDMYRYRAALGFDGLAVYLNRNASGSSPFRVKIGGLASYTTDVVDVEGRFGRVHESPRYTVRWEVEFNFGLATTGCRPRQAYSTGTPPPWNPFVVLASDSRVGPEYVPITPVTDVFDLPRYTSLPAFICASC